MYPASNATKVVKYKYSPEYSFMFSSEESFNRDAARRWMRNYWGVSLVLGAAYMMVVFGLRSCMRTRKPFKLVNCLIVWNWCLAVFSTLGFLRTAPEFFHVLRHYGYHFSVCNSSYADINLVTTFWGFLFAVSKVPELLDTVFIVLRKKPLIFLHYFHHFLTLVMSFYNYSDHPAIGRWIMVMNYAVHSVMYSYYALRAMNFRPPRWVSMSLTTMQIAQMIFGLVASLYSTSMIFRGYQCSISSDVAVFMVLVYGMYFGLFVNFFVMTYCARRERRISGSSQYRISSGTRSKVLDRSTSQDSPTLTRAKLE